MLTFCTRSVLALAAGLVASFATCAQADGPYGGPRAIDLNPVPLPPPLTWRGFYIGGNVGGAWTTNTISDNLTSVSFDRDNTGFIGGVQIGYNYQIGNLVLGVEWDFDWTSIETSGVLSVPGVVGPLQASADTEWISTLAARIGLALDRTLVYVKVGGGWVRNEASITQLATGASVSASTTSGAWVVGAGFEYALAPNWTAKFEYDFVGLSDKTFPGFVGTRGFELDRDVQQVKVGINFKF
jgi:outer membrane immunogenic protein